MALTAAIVTMGTARASAPCPKDGKTEEDTTALLAAVPLCLRRSSRATVRLALVSLLLLARGTLGTLSRRAQSWPRFLTSMDVPAHWPRLFL